MTPSYIPNIKSIAKIVAEISRGAQNFWAAPLAQIPVNFGPKSCFWQRYSVTSSYIPNLKSIASIVAEVSRGSQNFGDAPLAQTPVNFGPKSYFGMLLPEHKLLLASVAT